MAKTVGWGIIGLGGIANNQIAPAITASENSTLVGVVSRDAGRAQEFAQRHDARVPLDNIEALLADPDVDAVYIATPNALHADQAVAAARAGKHVLCDKPLATSLASAEWVISECAAAGVKLGITFQTRNHEGMAEVRKLIADGEIGKVVVVQLEMSGGRSLLRGWRTDPSLAGGGTVNNLGVHGYDLLRYLLDSEAVEVGAMFDTEEGFQLETTALSLLRFGSGALAYVNANQSVPNHQADLVIYGSEGRIVGTNVSRPDREGTFSITGRSGTSELAVSSAGAFKSTVSNFAQAVLDDTEPSPSGIDGLRSIEITEALTRAAQGRRTISLST